MAEGFDKAFWEERYRGLAGAHAPRPNPKLVAEAEDLAPGTALDAGCGEGADTIWLASRGWRVTAVDVATTALRRAREYARTLGDGVASRIDWVEADLTDWTPTEQHFDLVTAHYVHPTVPREVLVRRLAASVAPGGTLLIVDHHPSDSQASAPASHVTAEEMAAGLDPGEWDILVTEARARPATGHDGHGITIRDAILRARRRPA